MRFTLLSHGEPTGASDLETYDRAMRMVRGRFLPGPSWPNVREVYDHARLAAGRAASLRQPWAAAWSAVVAETSAARAALGFTLVDEAGRDVATTLIEIEEDASGTLELVVGLARPKEWLTRYDAPYRTPPEFELDETDT